MRSRSWRIFPILIFPFLAVAHGQTLNQTSGPWVMEQSGTTASLRGIYALGGGVAWASGTGGTVLRTEDGGYEWQSCAMPPGAEKLDFRGIEAWDDNTAIAMSSGPGDQSRLYGTTDGCAHWTLLYSNPDKDGFWDAIQCADRDHCVLLGDPVNGRFTVLASADGGRSWKRSDDPGLRSAAQEGAFAASNSSLLVNRADGSGIFGTGGPAGARVFLRSGSQWSAMAVGAFPKGAGAGIFSIARGSGQRLLAVGGDYTKPTVANGTAAWSSDGGRTWTGAARPPHGYRSSVAWDAGARAWIAAGTNGSDISDDDGKTWVPLDNGNWNALSLPWVVGPDGRIAKLAPGQLKKEGSSPGR